MTRHVVIGTAGHIDHGKSALVRALTGTDPDRLKEEKARGITIDLGFANWSDGDTQLAFVDVPGHERFVKNMLAGASGIDGVLLVIAADESVMPQTREHFDICRLLGVTSGIVALTKTDMVDRETVELVELETADLLAGSPLEDMPVVPVSARTGEGVEDVRRALLAMAGRCGARTAGGAARLPIDRAFTVKGFGTVVTGTLVSGEVAVDDTLTVLPAGVDVKVRGLQVHGAIQSRAVAGQRVAANFSGVGVSDVTRGGTAVTPGSFEATECLDGVIDLLPSARRLRHGSRVRFHHGTCEVLGRVALGPGLAGAVAGSDAPDALPPGGRAFARLRLEGAAVLTRGDRFILRAYSPPLTIAGGRVLDPVPPRGGIRTASTRTRMDQLLKGMSAADTADHDRALAVLIRERGLTGLPLTALVARAGLAPESVGEVVERLSVLGAVRRIGDRLLDVESLRDGGDRLLAMVSDFHRMHPLRDGVPREEARERVFRHAGPGIFDAVLDSVGGRRSSGGARSPGLAEPSRDPVAGGGSNPRRGGRPAAECRVAPAGPRSDSGAARRRRRAARTGVEASGASTGGGQGRTAGFRLRGHRVAESRPRLPQGDHRPGDHRRRHLQGSVRGQPEIRNSTAGVPGPGTSHAAGRREADRPVAHGGSGGFLPSSASIV